MKPILIIPAYNPDTKLITLVETIDKMGFTIVIINDGSRYECNEIFKTVKNRFGCIVCNHEKNKGKGNALKTGFQYVLDNFPHNNGCITADADGQHTPEDIVKIYSGYQRFLQS